MSAGFGTQPGRLGDEGIEVESSDQTPGEQIAEDIHAIRRRYVQPQMYEPRGFQLGQNGKQAFDFSTLELNCITLCVTSGVIFGWFGDGQGSNGKAAPGTAHFCLSASVTPATIQLMLPPGGYRIALQEGAAAAAGAVGSITPMAI